MLLVWVLSLIALALSDPCPPGTIYNNQLNVCYHFVSAPLSFLDAERHCHSMSGGLVSVGSAFENALIAGAASRPFAGIVDFWIGASYNSLFDQWMWIDLSPLAYRKWAAGEPASNECVSMQVNGSRWETAACKMAKPYVCMTAAQNPPPVTPPPMGLCDNYWSYFEDTNSCYYASRESSSFEYAEAVCVSLGGHLASVQSSQEYDFIKGHSEDMAPWSSMYLVNGIDWANTDGSPTDIDPVPLPVPTKGAECLNMDIQLNSVSYWTPVSCDNTYFYVCKKAANH